MARSKKKTRKRTKRTEAEPSPHLAEHMSLVGLESVEAYRDWCRRHGFPARIDKSWHALRREREEVGRQRVRAKMATSRKYSDPIKALALALEGSLDLATVGHAGLRAACSTLAELAADRPGRDELLELLRAVDGRGRFLLDSETVGGETLPYLAGLVALNERRGQWLRPLDEWRPRSHNRRKQFSSLVRHLVAEYPVPVFLDTAWLRRGRGSYVHRDLFVHIGRGGSPRRAKTPVPMTRKVAHHFLEAPDHYTIEGAVRWGQVHALGGGPRLADTIVATPMAVRFEHDEFWLSVIRFFIANPMLDGAQIGPIIDYIDHRKFTPTEVVLPDGSVVEEPPPHPGFSMARRTPESLLGQMERWHAQLGRTARAGVDSWPPTGIGELRWETGTKTKRVWTVRELRSTKALQLEGRAMKHCVVTYARSCAAGRSSIWSLELTTKDGVEKRQTVEVSRQRVIVQSRGKLNALPGQRDMDALRRWASQEQLSMATYL